MFRRELRFMDRLQAPAPVKTPRPATIKKNRAAKRRSRLCLPPAQFSPKFTLASADSGHTSCRMASGGRGVLLSGLATEPFARSSSTTLATASTTVHIGCRPPSTSITASNKGSAARLSFCTQGKFHRQGGKIRIGDSDVTLQGAKSGHIGAARRTDCST